MFYKLIVGNFLNWGPYKEKIPSQYKYIFSPV